MVYLDSGFFIALKNPRDTFHEHAKHIFAEIINGDMQKPYTCDYILDEAVTRTKNLIQQMGLKDLAHKKASEIGCEISSPTYWTMRFVPPECIKECVSTYPKYPNHSMSFTDWILYLMAKKYGETEVITNDGHFAKCLEEFGLKPILLMTNVAFKQWKEEKIKRG